MSGGLSPAERLFLPVYLFLKAAGWLYFLACMLPAEGAAFLLGCVSWRAVRPGIRRKLEERGMSPNGIWTVLLLWEALALGMSIFLGCFNGWWILYVRKGQIWGGALAAGCFLLGHLFPAGLHKNKEV